MKSLLTSSIAFLFFLLLSSCAAQEPNQKLISFLDNLDEEGYSGTVLVAQNGEVIYKNGFGYSDREKGIKNKPSTVITTGSITKQFTGAAILKMEMMGKLNVGDLMSKYIENVPEDKSGITLHHLLTHSAGFPGAIGSDDENIGARTFLEKAMKVELSFDPGSQYDYSNVGYSILGIIIEKVTGATYEQFLKQYLFDPAGMKKTGYVLPDYNEAELAVGYERGETTWGKLTEKNWGNEGPGWHLMGNGGIMSTVEDMYKWHQALLGTTILSKAAKEKLYSRHIEEGEGSGTYYGYGWAIFPTPRNTDLITHNGGNGIFFADFLRYLEEDITIMVMTNAASRKYESLPFQIAGTLLIPDFEPALQEQSDDDPNEEVIESIFRTFMSVIKKDDKGAWEDFLVANATNDFIKMADMDFHMEMFGKMHLKLKDQSPQQTELNDGELIVTMSGGNKLMIGFEPMQNGKIKIGGITLD